MSGSDPAAQAARKFLLEPFNDFLMLERGVSPRTDEAYGRDLARFATYAMARGAGGPTDVTARMLREYVYHLKDLGLAPASIRRNVSALRTYFKFLLGEGHVTQDSSERLESPKRWRTLPDVLSVAEIDRLLAAPTLDAAGLYLTHVEYDANWGLPETRRNEWFLDGR